MSAELTKARTLINSVNTHLKQGKLIAAANAIYESVTIILRNPLMKAEKDEFGLLLEQAVYQLSADKQLKSIFPLIISYSPGQEKELLGILRDLLNELQSNVADEAKGIMASRDKRRADGLAQGQAFIDAGDIGQARKVFDKLILEFRDDMDLRADIADRFLRASLYQEAFDYLDQALREDPNAVHLYNRIGIVLRKMKDFVTAEKYYKKAITLAKADDNLYFNLGRLYIDMMQWAKVAEAAEKALQINPGFAEAQKMLLFAQKKLR